MKCNNCGFENESSAKFCQRCGSDLTNSYYSESSNAFNTQNETSIYNPYNNQANTNKKKIIIAVLAIVALVAIIGTSIYLDRSAKKNSKIEKLTESLEAEKINKNYSKMAQINQSLYNLTKDDTYKKEIEKINKLKENDDKAKNIQTLIDNEEFEEAEKMILSLESSKLKDNEQIAILKSEFKTALVSRIDQNSAVNDYSSSIDLLTKLSNIDPENEMFISLFGSVTGAEAYYKEELDRIAQEEAEKAKKEEEEKNKQNTKSTADYLLGNYLYVSAMTANVRSGPDMSYPILFTLEQGDEIYVYNYSINDKGVIWLDCGNGWTSYKNFNGDLKY
jgi:hypothetical protein